mgnify:CR=1 FL=1
MPPKSSRLARRVNFGVRPAIAFRSLAGQRGSSNALRLQSVGKVAGIRSAIAPRLFIVPRGACRPWASPSASAARSHFAPSGPSGAVRFQEAGRGAQLPAWPGAQAPTCNVSVFQSAPLRHNLGLTVRPSRRRKRRGLTLVLEVSMKVWSVVVATGFASLSASAVAHASDPAASPLIGTWVLCQGGDNSPKDALQFFAEGYGFSSTPGKPKSPFLFKDAPGEVMLAVNAKGNLLTIYLAVNAENTRLTTKNDQAVNQAFYVREGEEQKNACTAGAPHL